MGSFTVVRRMRLLPWVSSPRLWNMVISEYFGSDINHSLLNLTKTCTSQCGTNGGHISNHQQEKRRKEKAHL